MEWVNKLRKRYTIWFVDHEETVINSFLLRFVHYWLFSPSVYYIEIGKNFYFTGVESGGKSEIKFCEEGG